MTFDVPETVDAPKSKAPASTRVTLLPLVMIGGEGIGVIEVDVVGRTCRQVVVPVTDKFPESVRAPLVVTFKVPEIVVPLNPRPASTKITLCR